MSYAVVYNCSYVMDKIKTVKEAKHIAKTLSVQACATIWEDIDPNDLDKSKEICSYVKGKYRKPI